MSGERGIRTNTYTENEPWMSDPFSVYTPSARYDQSAPAMKDTAPAVASREAMAADTSSVESKSANLDIIRESGDLQVPVESGFEGVQYYHGKNAVGNRQSREYKNTSILRIRTAKSASRLVYKTKEEPEYVDKADSTKVIQFEPGAYTDPIYKTKTKIKDPETNESEHQYYSLVEPTEKVLESIMQDGSKKLAPRQRILMNITREFIEEVNKAHLAAEQERATQLLAAAGGPAWAQLDAQSGNPFLRQPAPATHVANEVTAQGEVVTEDVAYKVTNAAVEQAAEPDNADTAETPKFDTSESPSDSESSDERKPAAYLSLEKPLEDVDVPERKRRALGVWAIEKGKGVYETAKVHKAASIGVVAVAALALVGGGSVGYDRFVKPDESELQPEVLNEAIFQAPVALESTDIVGQAEIMIATENGEVPAPYVPAAVEVFTDMTGSDISASEIPSLWRDRFKNDDNPDNDLSPDSVNVGGASLDVAFNITDAKTSPVTLTSKNAVVDLSKIQLNGAVEIDKQKTLILVLATQGKDENITNEDLDAHHERVNSEEFKAYATDMLEEEVVEAMGTNPVLVNAVTQELERRIQAVAVEEFGHEVAVKFTGELQGPVSANDFEIDETSPIKDFSAVNVNHIAVVGEKA